ncbi:hypothetical protein E1301_Tti006086 [Triplophysa tibetana]|uniref:Uncharacterized protein n=1 Tax=Triplophysa tibetana TaxID=1572043 RepID=A0A5A9PT04_9TELE|nr:hypothetical protein E1301_Tti006086 [Triplophysa tibetana]
MEVQGVGKARAWRGQSPGKREMTVEPGKQEMTAVVAVILEPEEQGVTVVMAVELGEQDLTAAVVVAKMLPNGGLISGGALKLGSREVDKLVSGEAVNFVSGEAGQERNDMVLLRILAWARGEPE